MGLNKESLERAKRVVFAKAGLLVKYPFYGHLLSNVNISFSNDVETSCVQDNNIYFNEKFIDTLTNSDLEFVLMHNVLHIALRHNNRGVHEDRDLYDLACDIVVNSNILYSNNFNIKSITLFNYGEQPHQIFSGEEGYLYTVNQVYKMLYVATADVEKGDKKGKNGDGQSNKESKEKGKGKRRNKPGGCSGNSKDYKSGGIDEHKNWKKDKSKDESKFNDEKWKRNIKDATEFVMISKSSKNRGVVPLFAERIYKELAEPTIDWKTLLKNYIDEIVVDYSFLPPDYRYESDFFLPAFNEKEMKPIDLLFMIDASGSMSDDDITQMYSEIKGAVELYNGRIIAKLGFFDANITEPISFCDEDELRRIKPKGGGGTDFEPIFEYVNKLDEKPKKLIIMTDGYAPFPDSKVAEDLSVLWIINNEEQNPPFGDIIRVKKTNSKKMRGKL